MARQIARRKTTIRSQDVLGDRSTMSMWFASDQFVPPYNTLTPSDHPTRFPMQPALDWLDKHHEDIVRGLADLVAIPSISTDGEHDHEIARTAQLTAEQMRDAGLHNVEVIKVGNSLPYVYGE